MKKRPVSIFTVIVILVLLLYLGFRLLDLGRRLRAADAENQALREEIAQESAKNDEMRYRVEHADEDEVIADVAREELGYVAPDETVFTPEE